MENYVIRKDAMGRFELLTLENVLIAVCFTRRQAIEIIKALG